jgi:hypothetical protein
MLKKINKFLSSDWTITLFATMIGVFSAIFLSQYFNQKKLASGKEKALVEVRNEIEKNELDLKKYQTLSKSKYEGAIYLFSVLNDQLEVKIKKEDLVLFKAKTISIFTISEIADLSDGILKVSGELNLNIENKLVLFNLSKVTWNSYKQTEFMAITKFKCLSEIENVYDLQAEVNMINESWREQFFKGDFVQKVSARDRFFETWKNLIIYQDLLLDFYAGKAIILEKCH